MRIVKWYRILGMAVRAIAVFRLIATLAEMTVLSSSSEFLLFQEMTVLSSGPEFRRPAS